MLGHFIGDELANSEPFYVQLTVHRENLRVNNQQDASSIQNFILLRNSTCFGHLLCPSSGVIYCTRGNWYVSCRLCGRCLGESGWKLTLLGTKRYMFRGSSVPIIRSYLLYTWQLVCFVQVIWPLRRRVRLELLLVSYTKIITMHGHLNKLAATPPNQPQRFILTDYFNNYNFSKLKQHAP
jgi:hypothetical protein